MKKPLATRTAKVGRYPLQQTASETHISYESADYLYEHPNGYIWLRTVHDLKSREHRLSLEFIRNGVKFSQWQNRMVAYTRPDLCRLAREFASGK
jgi:hypothetical protein